MLSQRWLYAVGFVWMAQMAFISAAHAYQTVKVGSTGAMIFVNPQSDSATSGTLPAGATVNIGDQPKNGYYRATGKGASGWIQEDALVIPHKAHPPKTENAAAHPAATPPAAAAAADKPGHDFAVGAIGGLGIASGGSSVTFGLEGDYKFSPMWGAGLYFTYLGLSGATTTTSATGVVTSTSASLLVFAAQLNYYLPQAPALFFGVKGGLGMATANATTSAGTNTAGGTQTGFVGGGAIGYDYPIIPELTIGAEANVLYYSVGNSSSLVNLLAAFKYVF